MFAFQSHCVFPGNFFSVLWPSTGPSRRCGLQRCWFVVPWPPSELFEKQANACTYPLAVIAPEEPVVFVQAHGAVRPSCVADEVETFVACKAPRGL